MGFMISENYENKKLFLIPSQVSIEGSMNPDFFEPIGNLELINDESYTNYRIKVFVKNLIKLESNNKPAFF